MALTLSGTGGLMTRIGKYGGIVQGILNGQGGGTLTAPAKSIGVGYTDLLANFTSGSAQGDTFDGFFTSVVTIFRQKHAVMQAIKTDVQQLLVRQVNDDNQLKSQTIPYAIAELVRQMGSSSLLDSKVSACSVAATTPATVTGITNTGSAVVTSSKTGPILPGTTTGSNAMDLQYIFPETVTVTCTADAQTGGASQYQETFSILGQPSPVTDPLIWNFTTLYGAAIGSGSNAQTNTNVCNAAVYQNAGPGGNMLNNGDFLTFTSHAPNQWTVVTGTAGTDFSNVGATNSSIVGSQCLALLHTNVAIKLTQQFGSVGGTTQTLLPNTVYAVNFWAKKDAGATGTIEIALVDGSDAIINDNNAVANSYTLDLSTLGTSYSSSSAKWAYFRTPAVLPAVQKIRLRTTVANQVANAYISHLAMRKSTPIYVGGPYVDIFSGATASILGDTYSAPFTNDYGNVGTGKVNLQTLFNWFFDLRIQGIGPIPILGTTLVNDNLIS